MTNSWVIRETASKRVICETYNAKAVEALNTRRYEAVPIQKYLASLNAPAPLCLKCQGHQTSTDAGNQPCKACGGSGSQASGGTERG